MTDEFYTFAPASEKQAIFLSSDADIIIYGGELRLHLKLS